MRAFHSTYDLDRYPALAAVTRAVVGVAVVATLAAAWITAGPGNGYQPPEQWAAVHRPDVVRVTLPRVVVVGGREADAQAVASVSCAKGA